MYKSRQITGILAVLIMLMITLCFKLILVKNKFIAIKSVMVFNNTEEKNINVAEKYGYSDILECVNKSGSLQLKSVNMMGNEKCNVEVQYNGDIKLLYDSLYGLHESRNFLGINSISIGKDANIANISIDFKKNK
jgi:hypothetical protein